MKNNYNFIRTALCSVLLLAILAIVIPKAAMAQDTPVYALVEFMKTSPENESKYVDLEMNVWKKLHQERINRGLIVGWYLYRVQYTAANDPYNYVTVTLFNDRSKLENYWGDIDPATVLPDTDIDEVFEETIESRDLVSSNLMNRIDMLYPPGSPEFKYLQLDYMKVKQGHDGEYVDTEVNMWKPIHQQFINAGSRIGWSLWGRIFPSGYGLDFQYVTVNYFSDYSQIGTANYNDAYIKANLGMSINEISEITNKSRLLVKSELWEVIDKVVAQ